METVVTFVVVAAGIAEPVEQHCADLEFLAVEECLGIPVVVTEVFVVVVVVVVAVAAAVVGMGLYVSHGLQERMNT